MAGQFGRGDSFSHPILLKRAESVFADGISNFQCLVSVGLFTGQGDKVCLLIGQPWEEVKRDVFLKNLFFPEQPVRSDPTFLRPKARRFYSAYRKFLENRIKILGEGKTGRLSVSFTNCFQIGCHVLIPPSYAHKPGVFITVSEIFLKTAPKLEPKSQPPHR